jgi:hypothetical protein
MGTAIDFVYVNRDRYVAERIEYLAIPSVSAPVDANCVGASIYRSTLNLNHNDDEVWVSEGGFACVCR